MKLVVVVFSVLILAAITREQKEGWRKRDSLGRVDDSDNDSDDSSPAESANFGNKKLDKTDRLTFHVIANLGYHFPHNRKQEKVALLDHHHNTSVFYDGLSGDTFAFAYEEGIGVYIPAGVSDKTWDAKKQSFEDYFKQPVPPKDLFSIGVKHGFQFDPQMISDELSEKLSGILTPLSIDYSDKCEALATALRVSKITSDKLKTSLTNFENVMGNVNGLNRGDFKWLVGLYHGLAEFFAPFGSIDALNRKHIRLDLENILLKEGGIYVLCYLLEALTPHFHLGKIIGNQMNSELEFFILINKLGGEIDYGSDGLVYVLTEITKYNYGESSKETLLVILRRYFTDPRGRNDDIESKWRSSVQILQKTIKKLKLEKAFNGLSKLLKNIEDGKWEQKGVNMSEILGEIIDVEIPGKTKEADKIFEKLDGEE